jgi:hypothetical protein
MIQMYFSLRSVAFRYRWLTAGAGLDGADYRHG